NNNNNNNNNNSNNSSNNTNINESENKEKETLRNKGNEDNVVTTPQPFLCIMKLREIGYEGLVIAVLEQVDLLDLFENGFARDPTRNEHCLDWKLLHYLIKYLCDVLKDPKLVAWNTFGIRRYSFFSQLSTNIFLSFYEQKCLMIMSWLIVLIGGILKNDSYFAMDKCFAALQLVRSTVSYCLLVNR
ncbi:hypothetical protein RFI_05634, partial [Reticulomyxa filosa]